MLLFKLGLFFLHITIVDGYGQLIVHLKQFTDIRGVSNNGQICKVDDKIGCNVTVKGCISTIGIPDLSKECVGAALQTHQVYYNQTRIRFSEKEIEYIFKSWEGALGVYLQIDHIGSNNTRMLIDKHLISIPMNVSKYSRRRKTLDYTFKGNVSTLNMSVSAQCSHYWYGKYCDKFCSTKGKDSKKFTCNKTTGELECKNHDYYGPNCTTYCHASQTDRYYCNSTDGSKVCEKDFYGVNCTKFCKSNHTGNFVCNKTTGEIQCSEGYHGVECKTYCLPSIHDSFYCNKTSGAKICYKHHFGANCSTYCKPNMNSGHYICNVTTGEKICNPDYYGENCSTYCKPASSHCHYVCNQTNGEKVCFQNYYGKYCSVHCHPPANNSHYKCDKKSGKKECDKGWHGDECDQHEFFSKFTKRLVSNKVLILIFALIFVILATSLIVVLVVKKRKRNQIRNDEIVMK